MVRCIAPSVRRWATTCAVRELCPFDIVFPTPLPELVGLLVKTLSSPRSFGYIKPDHTKMAYHGVVS